MIILASCGKTKISIEPQRWKQFLVQLELRPSPLPQKTAARVYEFIVIVNDLKQKKVASRLVVSLRPKGRQKWLQAIQDGHVGVYRRAMPISLNDTLIEIEIDNEGHRHVLEFLIPKR